VLIPLRALAGMSSLILFPETDEYICDVLVKRIKSASDYKFQAEGWSISLSIGHTTETGKTKSTDEILHDADKQMYAMKKNNQ